jgi:hypothetical protein
VTSLGQLLLAVAAVLFTATAVAGWRGNLPVRRHRGQIYQGCRAIHVLSLGPQGDSVTRRAADPARQLARILNS